MGNEKDDPMTNIILEILQFLVLPLTLIINAITIVTSESLMFLADLFT